MIPEDCVHGFTSPKWCRECVAIAKIEMAEQNRKRRLEEDYAEKQFAEQDAARREINKARLQRGKDELSTQDFVKAWLEPHRDEFNIPQLEEDVRPSLYANHAAWHHIREHGVGAAVTTCPLHPCDIYRSTRNRDLASWCGTIRQRLIKEGVWEPNQSLSSSSELTTNTKT